MRNLPKLLFMSFIYRCLDIKPENNKPLHVNKITYFYIFKNYIFKNKKKY